MRPCQSAGRQCPHEAVLTARIHGVGDRPLCQGCFESYQALGVEMRVLDPNAFIPTWRTRNLAKDYSAMTEPAL